MADEDIGGLLGRRGALPSMFVLVAVFFGLTQLAGPARKDGNSPAPAPPARTSAAGAADARPVLLSPTPFLRPLELILRTTNPRAMFIASGTGEPTLNDAIRTQLEETDPSCASPAMLDTPLCRHVVVEYVKGQLDGSRLELTPIIATVTDWVDSGLRWMFDGQLDAIQIAAAREGYVQVGFDLLELNPRQPDPSTKRPDPHLLRLHERTPGALLFRKDGGDQPDKLLLVLLVGETPTAGIHPAALSTALDLVADWTGGFQSGAICPEAKIIGPTYSGSSWILRRTLDAAAVKLLAHCTPATTAQVPKSLHGTGAAQNEQAPKSALQLSHESALFRVITPSASTLENRFILAFEKDGIRQIAFESVSRSDPEVLTAMANYLGRINSDWQCGTGVALLVEANTSWGNSHLTGQQAENLKEACTLCRDGHRPDRRPLACATLVPFPIHISRLRSTAARVSQPAPTAPGAPYVALSLDEGTAPSDQIPEVTPELTGATVELMLAGMFQSIERRGITAIGIQASDKRDHVFLAEQIARQRPNVQMFSVETNLIFLHPDVGGFVRGTLLASTYSLNDRTQILTNPEIADHSPTQFSSSIAHGEFNAMLKSIGSSPELLEYDAPTALNRPRDDANANAKAKANADADADAKHDCKPPVWISVVGRDSLLPLAYYSSDSSDSSVSNYVTPARCSAPGRSSGHHAYLHDSWLFVLILSALLIAMEFVRRKIIPERRVGIDLSIRAAEKRADGSDPGSARRPQVVLRLRDAQQELTVSNTTCLIVEFALGLCLARLLSVVIADQADLGPLPLLIGQVLIAMASLGAILYACQQLWHLFWEHGTRGARVLRIGQVLFPLTIAAWAILPLTMHRSLRVVGVCFLTALASALLAWLGDLVMPVYRQLRRPWAGVVPHAARWRRLAAAALGRVTGAGVVLRDGLLVPARLRRIPALLGTGALAGLAAHISALWVMQDGSATNSLSPWMSAVDSLLYVDRMTQVSSLLSPSILILGICLAMYTWAFWNARRAQLLRTPEIEVGVGELLDYAAKQAGLDPDAMLRSPRMTVGWMIIIPLAAAAIGLGWGYGNAGTIEGRAFNALLLLGSTCVLTAYGHTLAHSWRLGLHVLRLLQSLAQHPIAKVFDVIKDQPLNWRMDFREVTFGDLRPVIRRIAQIGMTLATAEDLESQGEVTAVLAAARTASDNAFRQFSGATSNIKNVDPASCPAWLAVDHAIDAYVTALKRTRWRVAPWNERATPILARALTDMEYVVACHAAFVLRDLLTRLISGFTATVIGLLLLLTTHLLYDFQGRLFWLGLDASAIGIAGTFAVVLFFKLEKDFVLSRMWGSTPGQISPFSDLTRKMVTYAVITVATLMSIYFPEVVGNLTGLIGPAARLVK